MNTKVILLKLRPCPGHTALQNEASPTKPSPRTVASRKRPPHRDVSGSVPSKAASWTPWLLSFKK